MFEFVVLGVLLEGRHWNAVVELSAEGVHCVVDDDDVFEGHIFENSQIFYVNVVCCLDARVTVVPVLDQFACWVYIVENGIRIFVIRSRKNAHFKVFVRKFQNVFAEWPNVETCLQNFAFRCGHIQKNIGFLNCIFMANTVR